MLLFLNDIAASEVMVIFLFILLFFGSKSIPGIARTMGKTIRQIKDASDEVKAEIQKSGMEMKKDMNLKSIIRETEEDLTRPLDQMAQDMDEAMNKRSYSGRSKMQNAAPKPQIDSETEKEVEVAQEDSKDVRKDQPNSDEQAANKEESVKPSTSQSPKS